MASEEYSFITMTCLNCKQQFFIAEKKVAYADRPTLNGMICNWCPCCGVETTSVYREWFISDAPSMCPDERAKHLRLKI